MLTVISILSFACIFFLVVFINGLLMQKSKTLAERVEKFTGQKMQTAREEELKAPICKRTLKPILSSITKIMTKVLPSHKEAMLQKKLQQAGSPGEFSPREYLAFHYIAAAFFSLLILFIVKFTGNLYLIASLPAALALGWKLPDIYLDRKKCQRQKKIKKQLPDFLDLLTVNVEAGLGFDSAVQKVVQKLNGPLADEFKIMLREISLGKPRREALRNTIERIDIDDFTSFAGAVILGDELGMGISKILRTQSAQMRIKRRQFAEEQAMKAPVKIIFPLVFFIFPTIFVVLLGPAFLQIAKLFLN